MAENVQAVADEEISVEEAFTRLEGICRRLEDKNVSLEDSFGLYEQGVKLCKLAAGKLDMVEKKMLKVNEDGSLGEF